MDEVRITGIQVRGLFGRINYHIDLSAGNPIAIITAPNGMGKTTVLNLVTFLFAPSTESFNAIRGVPFEVFRCVLSNGKTVELKPEAAKPAAEAPTPLEDMFTRRSGNLFERQDYVFTVFSGTAAEGTPLRFQALLREASAQSLASFFESGEERSTLSGGQSLRYLWQKQADYLKETGCRIPVNYVRADRIQPVVVAGQGGKGAEPQTVSPLEIACRSISARIRTATDAYNEAVSKAKDELPQMFLSDDSAEDMDYEAFAAGWRSYREALTQYQEIGLIPYTEDFTKGRDLKQVYEEKGRFLSTYLRAFRHTTEPLKDIYERLRVFRAIINERNAVTGKQLGFCKGKVTLTADGRAVSPEILSSGEKHDFMMFYHLIFNSERGSLVLIDEPEISLHIEWQESYLDKLVDICSMNSLQAIIATHSPHIVNNHYDFLVNKYAEV